VNRPRPVYVPSRSPKRPIDTTGVGVVLIYLVVRKSTKKPVT
jgi:hypothetical protein